MLFNILYVEIEEFANADSLILSYYLLKYSENKIKCDEEDKIYDRLIVSDYKSCCDRLRKVISKINVYSEDLFILTLSNVTKIERILNDIKDSYLFGDSFNVTSLNKFLGVKENNMFDIFNRYYSSQNTISYMDMIDTIVISNCIRVLSNRYNIDNLFLCLDLNSSTEEGNILSFCLFSLNNHSIISVFSDEIIIKNDLLSGHMSYIISLRQVIYKIAKLGFAMNNLIFVYFSKDEVDKFSYLNLFLSVRDLNFLSNYTILSEDLSCLNYLNFNSYKEYNRLFSSSYKSSDRKCAESIVNVLSEMSNHLKLGYSEGRFTVESTNLRKDFSSDRLVLSSRVNCSYGIILDCEGTTENGCTEVGGIIYCRKSSYILKMETFSFTDMDLSEGFETLFKSFENVIQRYLPSRGINILVYGSNDEKMILKSFKGRQSKGMRRKIEKYFKFKDCRGYVYDYLDYNNIQIDNRRLSTVAESLGVKVIEPKHNALNDSKTLFNVLAKILMQTEEFLV